MNLSSADEQCPHLPVLLKPVLELTQPQEGNRVVDLTLGFAGYGEAYLRAIGPTGSYYGFDLDPAAIEYSSHRLAPYPNRCLFECYSSQFPEQLSAVNLAPGDIDICVADLGVSSPQLDQPERGFSFSQSGPLDMRLGPQVEQNLAEWLSDITERELADVIFYLGEERYSKRIARNIKLALSEGKITDTKTLADTVARSVPHAARHGNIHPATRTFLALRTAINRLDEELKLFLPLAAEWIREGGRLAVVSFHSLEDREVKLFIRNYCSQPQDGFVYRLLPVNKKPIVADEQEMKANPRARSAKLRVAIKQKFPV